MAQPTEEFEGLALYLSGTEGEGVLWIHGYTLDSTIWRRLWAELPGWRHAGVDLAGHGQSRSLRSDDTLTSLAGMVVRIARHHHLRHLVGLSFGGMVALQAAIEAPGTFASLTLGSPAVAGGPTDTDAATRNLQLAHLYRERGAGRWLAELWMRSPPDIFKGAARHPTLWDALVEVVGRHRWLELATNQMDQLTGPSQLSRLTSITCPSLVLVGEDDMAVFKRCAQLLRRALPECERVYVPSAGHLGLLEAPAEVAPSLSAHWRRATAPAARQTIE
jgi:2-succinyl-6-hydroxy-2,4-cyclohexadiene-1-carboxylate synthase